MSRASWLIKEAIVKIDEILAMDIPGVEKAARCLYWMTDNEWRIYDIRNMSSWIHRSYSGESWEDRILVLRENLNRLLLSVQKRDVLPPSKTSYSGTVLFAETFRGMAVLTYSFKSQNGEIIDSENNNDFVLEAVEYLINQWEAKYKKTAGITKAEINSLVWEFKGTFLCVWGDGKHGGYGENKENPPVYIIDGKVYAHVLGRKRYGYACDVQTQIPPASFDGVDTKSNGGES